MTRVPGRGQAAKSGGATEGRGSPQRHWVSLVAYGLNQQHPNNYKDIVSAFWENRGRPGSLQAYSPEVNGLLPAGRLDVSGVPDDNAIVEVLRG